MKSFCAHELIFAVLLLVSCDERPAGDAAVTDADGGQDGDANAEGSLDAASAAGGADASQRASNTAIPYCVETDVAITEDDEMSSSVGAEDVLPWFAQSRSGTITWADGTRTQLSLTFADVRLFHVESMFDPSRSVNIAWTCNDFLAVRCRARLTTADGRLDEEMDDLKLRRSVNGDLFNAAWTIPADQIGGSYLSHTGMGTCVLSVEISIVVRATAMSGQVFDTIALSACDAVTGQVGVTEQSGGAWGS